MPTLLETALVLVEKGCAVFPCEPRGKRPLTQHGFKEASTSAEQVRLWWGLYPDANIGMATGESSGIVVIDVDCDKGVDLPAAVAHFPGLDLSACPVIRTGGGGYHLYLAHPGTRVSNKQGLFPGVDIRGDGGYVIAPGSIHPSGNPYFVEQESELATVFSPDWVTKPNGKSNGKSNRGNTPAVVPPVLPATLEVVQTSTLLKRASAYLAAMPPSISGQGGHNALWNASLAMRKGFALSDADALILLNSEFNPRCLPPWSDADLLHKVAGAAAADLPEGYIITRQREEHGSWESLATSPAVAGDISWRDELTREKGKIESTDSNALRILENDERIKGCFSLNDLTSMVCFDNAPFKRTSVSHERTDSDDVLVQVWLEREWNLHLGVERVARLITVCAERRRFHPVRDYLGSLAWDGTPRCYKWLNASLGVELTPYSQTVAKNWLVSATARALSPGCAVEGMLILEGAQGIGKSTCLATLCPDRSWFTDNLGDLSNRDTIIETSHFWIVELGELASFSRTETSALKVFLTRRDDNYRTPYARHEVTRLRQTVFSGTTNSTSEGYLKDDTGNRRYWPVACQSGPGASPWKWIEANRDQLWAEAVSLFRSGHPWHMPRELLGSARDEQDDRKTYVADAERVHDWCLGKTPVTIESVRDNCFADVSCMFTEVGPKIIGRVLRAAGLVSRRTSLPNGTRRLVYCFPSELEPVRYHKSGLGSQNLKENT